MTAYTVPELTRIVGRSGRVKSWIGKTGEREYDIRCRLGCTGPFARTYRSGKDNGYAATLNKWGDHFKWHRENGDVK